MFCVLCFFQYVAMVSQVVARLLLIYMVTRVFRWLLGCVQVFFSVYRLLLLLGYLGGCQGILCCSWVFQVDAGVFRLLLGCVQVVSRVFRWLLGSLVCCYSVFLGCAMLFLGVQVVARVLGFCQVVLCGCYDVLGNLYAVKVVNLVFRWLLACFRLLLEGPMRFLFYVVLGWLLECFRLFVVVNVFLGCVQVVAIVHRLQLKFVQVAARVFNWLMGCLSGCQGAQLVSRVFRGLLGVWVVARVHRWLLGCLSGCQGAQVAARVFGCFLGCIGGCQVVGRVCKWLLGCVQVAGSVFMLLPGCLGGCQVFSAVRSQQFAMLWSVDEAKQREAC